MRLPDGSQRRALLRLRQIARISALRDLDAKLLIETPHPQGTFFVMTKALFLPVSLALCFCACATEPELEEAYGGVRDALDNDDDRVLLGAAYPYSGHVLIKHAGDSRQLSFLGHTGPISVAVSAEPVALDGFDNDGDGTLDELDEVATTDGMTITVTHHCPFSEPTVASCPGSGCVAEFDVCGGYFGDGSIQLDFSADSRRRFWLSASRLQ